jgi:hypothetical protein
LIHYTQRMHLKMLKKKGKLPKVHMVFLTIWRLLQEIFFPLTSMSAKLALDILARGYKSWFLICRLCNFLRLEPQFDQLLLQSL